jgi:hypothetical protein
MRKYDYGKRITTPLILRILCNILRPVDNPYATAANLALDPIFSGQRRADERFQLRWP